MKGVQGGLKMAVGLVEQRNAVGRVVQRTVMQKEGEEEEGDQELGVVKGGRKKKKDPDGDDDGAPAEPKNGERCALRRAEGGLSRNAQWRLVASLHRIISNLYHLPSYPIHPRGIQ